jgi:hypothetical protein
MITADLVIATVVPHGAQQNGRGHGLATPERPLFLIATGNLLDRDRKPALSAGLTP